MVESLRDKQKQVARELIMQAAADLIVEAGLESLSLADVAARAGVSKRTLYNYFDSRETLLAAIGAWSDQLTIEMGGALAPEGLDTLPEVIQAVWRTWAAQGTIYQALLKIEAASSESGISEGRKKRRAAMAAAIDQIRPELGPDHSNELAAVFHAIGSAPVFERLTVQDGLSVDTAGSLVAWTMSVMRDALENGNDPYTKEEQA
ncbi:MAG: TetR/AcrR family transcriptional regulator [Acidimicrobiales bacterium]